MKGLSKIGLVLIVVASLSAASTSAKERSIYPISQWSERGIFSFGGLSFDFFYNRWREGGFGGTLLDCSNGSMYCMRGDPFHIALPRDCSVIEKAAVGQVWSVESVRSEVLFIENAGVPPIHGGAAAYTIFLGDPKSPHIIWQYDRNLGVTRIFKDDSGAIDFVKMARMGRVSDWRYGYATDSTKRNKVRNFSGFDKFGACGSVKPLSEISVP